MDHHQMTTRLLLIFLCLLLLGGLLYYYISSGIIQIPAFGSASSTMPVAQSPVASTSLMGTSNTTTSTVATSTGVASSPTAPSKPVMPVSPTQPSNLVTITNADNNSTVTLTSGQEFGVNMGSGLHWTVQFDPASSIKEVAASSTTYAQGVYKALTPGTVSLKATGAPICKPDEACPMFMALMTVTLEVK